jgi:hypothetical protein
MDAQRASPQRAGLLCGPLKVWDAGWVSGDEEIAPSAEVENVVTFVSQLFQDVNATVHQADHGVARPRPPVAVTFRGCFTGQSERRTFVHQDHIFDAVPDGQVIGSADPSNSSATDDDVTG